MRKSVAVVALLLAALTACQSPDSQSTTTPTTGGTIAKVGSPLLVKTQSGSAAEASVLSVATAAEGKGELAQPPANGQYVVIDVELKATGKELVVNPLYLRYQTADGKTFDVGAGNGFGSGFDPQLAAGTIPEGQSTRGLVVIDAPTGTGKQVQLTDELGTVIGVWEL